MVQRAVSGRRPNWRVRPPCFPPPGAVPTNPGTCDCLSLSFVVPGPPVPKGRPRFGNGVVRTPAKTKAYEKTVATYALQARCRVAGWPLDKRYSVNVVFVRIDGRADVDNVVKASIDACNHVLWVDDRQVWRLSAERREDGPDRLEVTVEVI